MKTKKIVYLTNQFLLLCSISFSQLHVDSENEVGIGTFTPEAKLHINANIPQIRFEESDQLNKKWHLEVYNKNFVITETGVQTRIALAPGGNVGINNEYPSYNFHVNAARNYFQNGSNYIMLELYTSDPRIYCASSNKIVFYNTFTSQHINIEAKNVAVPSDIRLKKDIKPLSNSLDK